MGTTDRNRKPRRSGAQNRRMQVEPRREAGALVRLEGLAPVPLSNVAPALIVMLISFAYLEEDGVLLCGSLLGAVVVLSITSAAIWQAVVVSGRWL
jgi:hypothetical protein